MYIFTTFIVVKTINENFAIAFDLQFFYISLYFCSRDI